MAQVVSRIVGIHILVTGFIFFSLISLLNPSFQSFSYVTSYAVFATVLLLGLIAASTKIQDFSFLFSSLRWVSKDELPHDFVSNIEANAINSKFKITRWGVLPDGIPQIFSYGLSPYKTRLIVSDGFLKNLTLAEQKSLLTVQIGRIANRDTVLITYLQSIPTLIYMALQMIEESLKKTENPELQKTEKNYHPTAAVAYLWGFYFAFQFFVLWIQRRCDLAADRFAFQLLGNADQISSALAKIHLGASATPLLNIHPGKAFGESGFQNGHSFSSIERKIQWDLTNPWAPIFELFSPHALLGRRIEALSSLAKQSGRKTDFQFSSSRNSLNFGLFAKEFSGLFAAVGLTLLGAVLQFGLLPHLNLPDFFTKYWPVFTSLVCVGLYILITSLSSTGEFPETTIGALLEDSNVGPLKGRRALVKASVVGIGDPGNFIYPRLRIRDATGDLEVDSYYLTANDITSEALAGAVSSAAPIEFYGWFRRGSVPTFDVYKAVGPVGTAQARIRFIATLIFILLPIGYYAIMYMSYWF